MSAPLILIILVAAIAVWAIAIYNRFVTLTARVAEAWADIDVQLKRRYDLIPNLVETVKGYAAHESGTLERVTEMRTRAMNATTPAEHAQADSMLAGALKSIFAVAENYPNLKANENFLELQRELSDTENKLQAARRFYNTVVMELNASLKMFPNSLLAGGFSAKEYFELSEADAAAKEPVKVQF
jgi:LemA protein